jgi:V-type H+-transporting ATPase subunit a
MKMSVIIGVTQMMLGIFISLFNARFFKKPLNIYFEFIPQVIFMMCTFGYMVILIIYKWSINWRGGGAPSYLGTYPAPMILNLMIKMFLSPQVPPPQEYYIYNYQGEVQIILIVLAVISIPVMLFCKPAGLYLEHKNKSKYEQVVEPDEHGEEWDFSEIMVHQIIHTIEFVLGAISNTASYLRLWALSLAHAELSVVFLDMVLVRTLSMTPNSAMSAGAAQFLAIFAGFAVWAALTMAVLLGMESMSAFLHALRLHWVEFQNKFYMGDGYKFAPFNYKTVLADNDN